MQPLQVCIGPIIRIGRESWCLPYAGFLVLIRKILKVNKFNKFNKLIKIRITFLIILANYLAPFCFSTWTSGLDLEELQHCSVNQKEHTEKYRAIVNQ